MVRTVMAESDLGACRSVECFFASKTKFVVLCCKVSISNAKFV